MPQPEFTPAALATACCAAGRPGCLAARRRRRPRQARAGRDARLADLVERRVTDRPAEAHMRALPLSIGTIHFVGIGGIGMSGIAEVLHNLGYAVQGSDIADSANVAPPARGRHSPSPSATTRPISASAQVVVVSTGGEARQPRGRGGARAAHSGGAAGRDAGRADAAEMVDRDRRHPWQDHHHQPDRRRAGGGASRPHRDQRRHHQRLRHQHPPRRRRMDGGRGRRERRQFPAPAGHHRGRHQHGPRAPRPLGHRRGDGRGLRPVRRQRAVLRLCGAVHRPPRRCSR